jgi:uncharacterized membrane protein
MSGVLFLIAGDYRPKTASNFFFGIRTPWTLSDDTVWASTHRLGGPLLMVLGGVVIVAAALGATVATVTLVVGSAAFAVATTAFSYWKYRQIARAAERPSTGR